MTGREKESNKDKSKDHGAVDNFHYNNSFINRWRLPLFREKSGVVSL